MRLASHVPAFVRSMGNPRSRMALRTNLIILQTNCTALAQSPATVLIQQPTKHGVSLSFLVGFFTSLSLERIMESGNHLVQQYAAKQSADISDMSFTVQFAATEPKLKVFQGRLLKDTRSKQESFGSKICVTSVSYLCMHLHSLT